MQGRQIELLRCLLKRYNNYMIILPKEVIELMKKFRENKFQIYLVGGAVRDALLNKKVDNFDFTTNATPEQIQKLFPDSFYNNVYGTVSIPVETQNFASLHF